MKYRAEALCGKPLHNKKKLFAIKYFMKILRCKIFLQNLRNKNINKPFNKQARSDSFLIFDDLKAAGTEI